MDTILTLDNSNIDKEHICCAISDKKCKDSYELKKAGLKRNLTTDMFFVGLMHEQKSLLSMDQLRKVGLLLMPLIIY